MAGNRVGLVVVDDSTPEEVADVRRQRIDLPLVAVERQREELTLRQPEVGVEPLLQHCRFVPEARRELGIVPNVAREARTAALRVVDVALDLARRNRAGRERPVGEQDRVPRVLPALVLEARLGVPPLVLDVAVSVAVAVAVDPRQSSTRLSFERAHEVDVPRPALDLVEQDEKERRRVGGAVVGRMRTLLERRQLAEPQLVENLSRFLVAKVVDARSLSR